MKIAVLGSNGQLGSDIIGALKSSNHQVIALNRNALDLKDLQQIPIVLSSFLPFDILINCTAMTNTGLCEKDRDESFKVNSQPLLPISKFCLFHDVKLFHISTDYVFDGLKGQPYDEKDTTNPLNVYGLSKLSGEHIIQSQLEKYFIFRTSSLYGIKGASGKGGNFVETMLKKASKKEKIKVINDQFMSPTHTLDLAHCLTSFISQNITDYGVYHFTNDGVCSWFEFTQEIFKLMNLDTKVSPVSFKDFPSVLQRPQNSSLNNQKTKQYFPTKHWKKGLKEYLNLRGYL